MARGKVWTMGDGKLRVDGVEEDVIRLAVCATCGGWTGRTREAVLSFWRSWDLERRAKALNILKDLPEDKKSALVSTFKKWPAVEEAGDGEEQNGEPDEDGEGLDDEGGGDGD